MGAGWWAARSGGSKLREGIPNGLLTRVAAAAAVASVAVGLPAGMALGYYRVRLKGLVIFFVRVLAPVKTLPIRSGSPSCERQAVSRSAAPEHTPTIQHALGYGDEHHGGEDPGDGGDVAGKDEKEYPREDGLEPLRK